MPAETAKALKVPGFLYRGFAVPDLILGAELIENLGAGEPAYKLALQSAPLAWRVALYTAGRDLAIGEPLADDLPDSAKEAGKLIYEDAQRRKASNPSGCWHSNGIIYLPMSEKPRGVFAPKGYSLIRQFSWIEGFDEKDDEWVIKPSEKDPEGSLKLIPPGEGGFIVPTPYGAYDPDGFPYETVIPMEDALQRWVDAGFTEQQARKELSRHYKMREGYKGTAAVDSWSDGGDGPLCVGLDNEPGSGGASLGSFPASRSAERSEAPKNTGFRTVTEAEYKAFVEDRDTLEAVRKRVGR